MKLALIYILAIEITALLVCYYTGQIEARVARSAAINNLDWLSTLELAQNVKR